ncbi:MAG TPA: glycoside hydrolase family 3 N-terminal domain-containing protein [Anaerolineales bacterium]|nr:glycoside hydrolase family 3 N-terminal domain-containing protein [Anaerolineales bacterium]
MRLRLLALLLLTSLAAAPLRALPLAPPADRADELLAAMTPEERVGQLFLITIDGVPTPESPVFELIRRGHVAGVVLRSSHDNFVAEPATLASAHGLIQSLQEARILIAGEAVPTPPSQEEARAVYVPLLVGISLNREGSPYPELIAGLSEPLTEMSLGATWDPNLAREVGAQVGKELSALGFNLFLGPSLDVLDETTQGSPGDLGSEAFGGDPYWVSEMGSAYVAGLHQGTGGRAAIIAKHFPGTGGSDRPPGDEVATVRKSLDSLQLVDLAPFFAVTGGVPGVDGRTVDGVLLSHIRYQGLQGNIRQTTRPVSLDRAALGQILGLGTFPQWRTAGGVIIADSLGSRAIRRFYDPAEQAFNGPLVAREAFLAGSDLLLLDDFVSAGDPDAATTFGKTVSAFATRYQEDPVFADQVDAAALRVLRLKLRLYGGEFDSGAVLESAAGPGSIEPSAELAFRVARLAASHISPADDVTPDQLGESPAAGERLVMFTDVERITQCRGCPSQPVMSRTALEETIAELYGPRTGGQARSWNLTSYSMADLAYALGERPPPDPLLALAEPEGVLDALEAADWLVFSLLSSQDGRFGSDALRLLLDRRPDQIQGKRVAVFAFDVPYELDATDISKIDLFYALYAPRDSFVNTAARLLFQELVPTGASPVSVAGVGYDLLQALSPDPQQTIPLTLGREPIEGETLTPEPGFTVGDSVVVTAGVIVDRNGRPVPDGTPVQFQLSLPGEALSPVLETTTSDGVGRVEIRLDRVGLHTIRSSSDPARTSNIIQLDVQEGVPAFATVIAPTPPATETPAATDTAVVPTVSGGGGTSGGAAPVSERRLPNGSILIAVGLGLAAFGGGAVLMQRMGASRRDRFRAGLIGSIGAVLGFNYLALGFPGSSTLMADRAALSLAVFALVGGAVGVAAGIAWWRRGWKT